MPYVRMTLRTLESFGVHVRQIGDGTWRIPPQDYAGRRYRVEGDHSSASYFLAAAVAAAGSVRVEGLDPESAQADACFGRLLREAGATVREESGEVRVESSGTLRPFDVDLADAPDLAPTVAVAALFASGPCLLRGLAHLRVKESDRLEALADNLARLGAAVAVDGDAMSVSAGAGLHGATILTRSDHRMAMAFAVAGLRVGGVVIDDAACVAKSNPAFWDDFAALEGDGLRTGS
jgi:3-phosphoshikimate 1-carboxyvinyltransferase